MKNCNWIVAFSQPTDICRLCKPVVHCLCNASLKLFSVETGVDREGTQLVVSFFRSRKSEVVRDGYMGMLLSRIHREQYITNSFSHFLSSPQGSPEQSTRMLMLVGTL